MPAAGLQGRETAGTVGHSDSVMPIKAQSSNLTRLDSHIKTDLPVNKQTKGEKIVSHWAFQTVVLTFVLLNTLQLGLSIQYPEPPWKSVWRALEHVFTCIFAVEMCVKLFLLKWKYFYEMWNCIDFLLAWTSILDIWILQPIIGSEKMSQFTAFRMLRIGRVLRVVTVMRMKRELLVLVEGMIASLKGMCWVSLLLFLFIYAGAIVFNTLIVQQQESNRITFETDKYFGDLWSAMLTLFGICIGAEWSKYVWPLTDANRRGVVICLIVYFFIAAFGFLNIIIGVIVDHTNDAAAKRDREDMEHHRRHQMHKVKLLVKKFDEFNANDDGELDQDDFNDLCNNDDFRNILSDLQLPIGFTMTDLQLMLDEDMDGSIKSREFKRGLQRLIYCNQFQHHCMAKLERARILQSVRELSQQVFALKEEFDKKIESSLEKAVQEIKKEMTTSIASITRVELPSSANMCQLPTGSLAQFASMQKANPDIGSNRTDPSPLKWIHPPDPQNPPTNRTTVAGSENNTGHHWHSPNLLLPPSSNTLNRKEQDFSNHLNTVGITCNNPGYQSHRHEKMAALVTQVDQHSGQVSGKNSGSSSCNPNQAQAIQEDWPPSLPNTVPYQTPSQTEGADNR